MKEGAPQADALRFGVAPRGLGGGGVGGYLVG